MNNRPIVTVIFFLVACSFMISATDSSLTREPGLFFYGNHSKLQSLDGKQIRLLNSQKTRFSILKEDVSGSGEKFGLEFGFSVWYNKVFANIFEIKNGSYQLALRYLYHPDSSNVNLQLRVNGKFVLLSFPVPLAEFSEHRKFTFKLSVDENRGSITAILDGLQKKAESRYLKPGSASEIIFGSMYRDGDCMDLILRDLKLTINGELKHRWKFTEVSGSTAYDSEGDLDIKIDNPGWQMSYYYNWQPAPLPDSSRLKDVTSFYRLNTNNRKAALEEKPNGILTGNLLPVEMDSLDLVSVKLDTVYKRLYAVLRSLEKSEKKLLTFSLYLPAMTEKEYRERLNLIPEPGRRQYPGWITYTGAGIVALLIPLFIIIRRLRHKKNEPVTAGNQVSEFFPDDIKPGIKNLITLFGGLRLIDRDGSEIQSELTPKLQEIFSAVLYYSTFGKTPSVPLRKLEKIIWSDIPKEKLKNNRNVAFSKIRKTLNKLDSVKLEIDDDRVLLTTAPPVTNEMAQLASLFSLLEVKGKISIDVVMEKFSGIIKGGTILEGIKSDWAERERFALSNRILEILLLRCAYLYESKDFHACNKTAGFVDLFDPANEEAFKYKLRSLFHLGRHSLVEEAWQTFQKEYETVYGKKYPHSIQTILKN